MRFLIYLSLALALLSFAGMSDRNLANAADSKSDMDDGLVVCSLNSEEKIMCNCKQGTQGCTDMIKNSCGKGGAHCAGGYCSCEAKDTMFKSRPSPRAKSFGSGTVITTPPKKPTRFQDRMKSKALGGSALGKN